MPLEKSLVFWELFDAWIGDQDLQIDILRLVESDVLEVQEVDYRILALDNFLD
jgi:hypothetical protein